MGIIFAPSESFCTNSHTFFYYIRSSAHKYFTFLPYTFITVWRKFLSARLLHPARLSDFSKISTLHVYYIRSFIRYSRVVTIHSSFLTLITNFQVTPFTTVSAQIERRRSIRFYKLQTVNNGHF